MTFRQLQLPKFKESSEEDFSACFSLTFILMIVFSSFAYLTSTLKHLTADKGQHQLWSKGQKFVVPNLNLKLKKLNICNPFLRLDVQISKIYFYGENIFLFELGIKISEFIADYKNCFISVTRLIYNTVRLLKDGILESA